VAELVGIHDGLDRLHLTVRNLQADDGGDLAVRRVEYRARLTVDLRRLGPATKLGPLPKQRHQQSHHHLLAGDDLRDRWRLAAAVTLELDVCRQ